MRFPSRITAYRSLPGGTRKSPLHPVEVRTRNEYVAAFAMPSTATDRALRKPLRYRVTVLSGDGVPLKRLRYLRARSSQPSFPEDWAGSSKADFAAFTSPLASETNP